jgi:ribosomal protection tetracycline resistance protein
MSGIARLLPAPRGDAGGPPRGTVFKVERGPAGEKIAYVRMVAGAVRVRDRVRYQPGDDGVAKVTAIGVFAHGSAAPPRSVAGQAVTAGQIGKLWGLAGVRIGDTITAATEDAGPGGGGSGHHFAPPTLETVVVPNRVADGGALYAALTQLTEQDPLINLRQDPVRQEISVSLYGEVQKEVLQATLAEEYGVDVTFRESTTICVERPAGMGEAAEFIKVGDNPFLATVGLRIEPAPIGGGGRFRLGIELGALPLAFIKAVEETVAETLRQGLCGWEVTDYLVTMTRSGYCPRQSRMHGTFDKSMSSTAGDFRNVTRLVVMEALRHAGTRVHEPIHRFRLELPADTLSAVLPVLARLRAVPYTAPTQNAPETAGSGTYLMQGQIPAARVHDLERRLPALTRGEGVLESAFDHYEQVVGAPPIRQRTDINPLDRKEYLLHVVRRV